MQEKPILILAMRRVGGTALTRFLSEVSSYKTYEHEPFNADRSLGHITRSFIATKDHGEAESAINQSLPGPVVLKHCIDTVPHGVTAALIRHCRERGYGFILLTRENEVSRILSVAVAELTGIWGNAPDDDKMQSLLSGATDLQPFNIDDLLQQLEADRATLAKVRQTLSDLNIDFEDVVYERFFQTPYLTLSNALAVVKKLGIAVREDDPRLRKLAASPHSITQMLLDKVPNGKEASAILSSY